MAVTFLTGRSGTGKTEQLLQRIEREVAANPLGDPILVIVADQMTFQMEYELVKRLGGLMRVQVYSLKRLALKVLQETGGAKRHHLSPLGLEMLIRKIVHERNDELTTFRRVATKYGFVQNMQKMLKEFENYCVTDEMLRAPIVGSDDVVLEQKLRDLHTIYTGVQAAIHDKYTDWEDQVALFVERIAQSPSIQRASIYIDGFHTMSPQQLTVIEALCQTAPRLTFTVNFDEHYPTLFIHTAELYQQWQSLAESAGHDVERERLTELVRQRDEGLKHMADHFVARPASVYDQEVPVTIVQAANRRAEVEAVAREVIRLVRDEGKRYRDVAIVVRNGDYYYHLVETIMKSYHIPVFVEAKRSMLHHPIIEFIRSALEVITHNWRQEAVIRTGKTGILVEDTLLHTLHELENYAMARGLNGLDRWQREIHYRKYYGVEERGQTDEERLTEERLNDVRLRLVAPLQRFHDEMRAGKTVQARCAAVFRLIDEANIQLTVERWSALAEERQQLAESREHQQVLSAVVDILDQFVEAAGEEKMPLSEFSEILLTGLEGLQFSLIPPATDQVVVANYDLLRLLHVDTLFLIGANDGVLPKRGEDDPILNDRERDVLRANGIALAPSSRDQMFREDFAFYYVISQPKRALYVSYTLADEEGKGQLPSPYIKQLEKMLPYAVKQLAAFDLDHLTEQEMLHYVTTAEGTLPYLTMQLDQWKKGGRLPRFWWDVYDYFLAHPDYLPSTKLVLSSLFYKNIAQRLQQETSRALFTTNRSIQSSISKMEKFRACPFAHFARYGLKLKERNVYRLNLPQMGTLFHEALKEMSALLAAENRRWGQLTDDEAMSKARVAVARVTPAILGDLLTSSHRYRYILRKLEKIMMRAALVLNEHGKVSDFTEAAVEFEINAKNFPPLELADGTKVQLVGQIDRIDVAETSDGAYVRIIDYKSSGKDLDLAEVYYGLSLQMLTYLHIVVSEAETLLQRKLLPAGMLYFHLHNPRLSSDGRLEDAELAQQLLKQFKMKGYVLHDEAIVKMMDHDITDYSSVIPVRLSSKGISEKQSRTLTSDQFTLLTDYAKQQAVEINEQIVAGDIAIEPYVLKGRVACTHCEYRPVCQFDATIDGTFKRLKPLSATEALAKLGGTNDETNNA